MTARAHTTRPEGPVMTRTLTVATLTVAVLALLAAPVLAQDYPPEPEVAVGTPNATVTIHGADWAAGTEVVVTYEDSTGATQVTTAMVGDDGTFAADLALPADAQPGVQDVTVSGTDADGQPREWQPRILVQADDADADAGETADGDDEAAAAAQPDEPTPAAAGALPRTGLGSPLLAAIAVGLLGVGTAALQVARRRNRA